MPLITLKTMKGSSKESIKKTIKEINALVAKNLGYDASHVWVFVEEVEHDHFLTAGHTWTELKPILYKDQVFVTGLNQYKPIQEYKYGKAF